MSNVDKFVEFVSIANKIGIWFEPGQLDKLSKAYGLTEEQKQEGLKYAELALLKQLSAYK